MTQSSDRLEEMVQPSELTALPAGCILNDRFTITDVINTGGFSIIYRATDRLTGETVAVKECAPEGMVLRGEEDGALYAVNESALHMLDIVYAGVANEIDALRTLSRNNVTGIPQYVDTFSENNTQYLVMSEVRGADLHCWAESYRQSGKPFPSDMLEAILTGVLRILEQIHRSGFYHCDVKPANIIIDDAGHIFLIDFGAVRTKEKQHAAVQVSPGYTPVEMYPGYRASIGPWSDIYMLATLFYNILTGRVPDPANERAQADRTPRLSSDAALMAHYTAPLLNSIDKAMSVNAADRYPSANTWSQAYAHRTNGPQLISGDKSKYSYAKNAMSLSHLHHKNRTKRITRLGSLKPAPLKGSKAGTGRSARPALRPASGSTLRSAGGSNLRPVAPLGARTAAGSSRMKAQPIRPAASLAKPTQPHHTPRHAAQPVVVQPDTKPVTEPAPQPAATSAHLTGGQVHTAPSVPAPPVSTPQETVDSSAAITPAASSAGTSTPPEKQESNLVYYSILLLGFLASLTYLFLI